MGGIPVMVIIIDKVTGIPEINHGTNSAYPDGGIPNIVSEEGQEIVRIHDESPLAQQIQEAKYKWKFNQDRTEILDIETQQEKDEKEQELIRRTKLKRFLKIREENLLLFKLIDFNPDLNIPPIIQALKAEYEQLKQEVGNE